MKKGKKGLYKASIANGNLAKCLDTLRDEYRIKEKMFPVKIMFESKKHNVNEEYLEFKNIIEMGNYFLEKDIVSKMDDLIICRYDDLNTLIKKHVRRIA